MPENQNIEYKSSWRDEYPVLAVREMILNALIHRNYLGAPTQIRLYDDSFSIWNDGVFTRWNKRGRFMEDSQVKTKKPTDC